MKITDLSILCKWENLKNRQCINTYLPHCIIKYVNMHKCSISTFLDQMVAELKWLELVLIRDHQKNIHTYVYYKDFVVRKYSS